MPTCDTEMPSTLSTYATRAVCKIVSHELRNFAFAQTLLVLDAASMEIALFCC